MGALSPQGPSHGVCHFPILVSCPGSHSGSPAPTVSSNPIHSYLIPLVPVPRLLCRALGAPWPRTQLLTASPDNPTMLFHIPPYLAGSRPLGMCHQAHIQASRQAPKGAWRAKKSPLGPWPDLQKESYCGHPCPPGPDIQEPTSPLRFQVPAPLAWSPHPLPGFTL